MPAQLTPEAIAHLTGMPMPQQNRGMGFSPAMQGQMQQSLVQHDVAPNDNGMGGELMRRLMEIERTRRLSDPQGNAASAENTRRGEGGWMGWFLAPLKQPGYGGQ